MEACIFWGCVILSIPITTPIQELMASKVAKLIRRKKKKKKKKRILVSFFLIYSESIVSMIIGVRNEQSYILEVLAALCYLLLLNGPYSPRPSVSRVELVWSFYPRNMPSCAITVQSLGPATGFCVTAEQRNLRALRLLTLHSWVKMKTKSHFCIKPYVCEVGGPNSSVVLELQLDKEASYGAGEGEE